VRAGAPLPCVAGKVSSGQGSGQAQEAHDLHELSIARNICRAAADYADGRHLASMRVEVGVVAGVAIESLEFCIDELAADAGLGSPEVEIAETPARLRCSCGQQYETTDLLEPCPSCGGYERDIISGEEIRIVSIELEGENG